MKSRLEMVLTIEEIMSYLLSKKHEADVKIIFRKDKYDGDVNKTRDIDKEQVLDR